MAERTSVTQVVQFGDETTPGTAVAADKLLPSLQLSVGVEASHTEVLPSGYKFPTGQILGKEWTAAQFTSPVMSYDELVFLLSSMLSYAAPAQQGATTAYLWTQTIDTDAADTVKTFTVEQGSSVRAHKFAYGIVTDLTMRGDRDKVEVSGSMIGQRLSDGITLTATPTVLPLVPILADDVTIYADDTSAGLGGTKLTRVLSWEWSMTNRFSPLWVVDASETSWVAAVETPIQSTLKLRLEADAAGNAFITTMRASATKFFRIVAESATLAGTAYPYKMTLDAAAQVKGSPGKFEDSDGVYAYEVTFGLVHDATWGKALTIGTFNKQSSL